jgi:hypothetical protein
MHFKQGERTVLLRGVNLADGKMPTGKPSHVLNFLDEGEKASYVGSPLPLDEAPRQLERLRYLGFNVLRIPVVWEALEHEGPGIYDEDYLAYIRSLVELCKDAGFSVVINPHQDLWSRHSGGSGAPLWTLYACGLDPTAFAETHAAIRYAEWPLDKPAAEKNPKLMPAMMWTTNQNRLATSTVFAMFFAGKDFAPRCVIDGVNIQEYLQSHYMAAYARLTAALGDLPFGYDSMNEPASGFIGWNDLNESEREDTAKIGSTPTPIQSMRLGAGMSQTVDTYRLGSTGPHKTGTMDVCPTRSCWLQEEDPRWKWTRDPNWTLNTCVWALNGVWDTQSGDLLKSDYFSRLPETHAAATRKENESEGQLSFISSYWQEFHRKWTTTIRNSTSTALSFIQPSVFTVPPPRDDPLCAYSPHFYDGLTVMRRHWHERWNADVVGLIRGNYNHRILGLRVGKGNVKQVIADQIGQLATDLELPTLIGETGIPFDLDDGRAYDKDGDYTAHVKAMDALMSGCDSHLLSYTLWAYSATNSHEWGDGWNGEDLSIYCKETGSFPRHKQLAGFRAPAAWCRPYVQSISGKGAVPSSMSFSHKSSEFNLEIEAEGPGEALVYVPWLHYRRDDEGEELDLQVSVSNGQWSVDGPGQVLIWKFEGAGGLEIERASGPLSPKMLGTKVSTSWATGPNLRDA